MNFKLLFTQYCQILKQYKKELQEVAYFNMEVLDGINKTISQDKKSGCFSYEFANIQLIVPKKYKCASHSIPREFNALKIILVYKNDSIIIKFKKNALIEDPIQELGTFNLLLESDNYFSSWHLDRHVREDGENESKSLHPLYHMTFGGTEMESRDRENEGLFGNILLIRSPRIQHPPMEFVLWMDFIFRHFFKKEDIELLSNDSYRRIVREIKKHLWLPYSLAFAKNYCDYLDVDTVRCNFDGGFVSAVIGED